MSPQLTVQPFEDPGHQRRGVSGPPLRVPREVELTDVLLQVARRCALITRKRIDLESMRTDTRQTCFFLSTLAGADLSRLVRQIQGQDPRLYHLWNAFADGGPGRCDRDPRTANPLVMCKFVCCSLLIEPNRVAQLRGRLGVIGEAIREIALEQGKNTEPHREAVKTHGSCEALPTTEQAELTECHSVKSHPIDAWQRFTDPSTDRHWWWNATLPADWFYEDAGEWEQFWDPELLRVWWCRCADNFSFVPEVDTEMDSDGDCVSMEEPEQEQQQTEYTKLLDKNGVDLSAGAEPNHVAQAAECNYLLEGLSKRMDAVMRYSDFRLARAGNETKDTCSEIKDVSWERSTSWWDDCSWRSHERERDWRAKEWRWQEDTASPTGGTDSPWADTSWSEVWWQPEEDGGAWKVREFRKKVLCLSAYAKEAAQRVADETSLLDDDDLSKCGEILEEAEDALFAVGLVQGGLQQIVTTLRARQIEARSRLRGEESQKASAPAP